MLDSSPLMNMTDDSPETYKDAPLTVQLVGMRQEDEALAEITTMVDGILNDRT
jgi:amidase